MFLHPVGVIEHGFLGVAEARPGAYDSNARLVSSPELDTRT
jgi:hypothetical protein